jgi:hypothetical protein
MLPEKEIIEIRKLDAAKRQLDAAVRIFFNGEDAIAIHTLVGAASIVLFDLLEKQKPKEAWEHKIAESTNSTIRQVLGIARHAQNFFKHADSDSDKILPFNQRDTEQLLFVCTLNCGNLAGKDERLSVEQGIFQLWYIAVWQAIWLEQRGQMTSLVKVANQMFPDIDKLSRSQQLQRGKEILELEFAKKQLNK